jgi:uncharacterized protein DUF2267
MWTVLNPPWVPVLRREPALVLDPRANREGAEQAIRATLQTLAEHLTREEARQAAGLLPVELGPWLHTGSWEPFGTGSMRSSVAASPRRALTPRPIEDSGFISTYYCKAGSSPSCLA